MIDIYDDADWTEMDTEDLKASIEHGSSIEEAAQFLCRARQRRGCCAQGARTGPQAEGVEATEMTDIPRGKYIGEAVDPQCRQWAAKT